MKLLKNEGSATLLAAVVATICLTGCQTEPAFVCDQQHSYEVHFVSPNNFTKNIGDTIALVVDVQDLTGGNIHILKVRLYNQADGKTVYDESVEMPPIDTIHAFRYEDKLILRNNMEPHSDWVLEAKTWCKANPSINYIELLNFHLHP